MKMKRPIHFAEGFLLAIQFFTIMPVRKQIDMNDRTVPWMVGFLPVIGLLMGASILAVMGLAQPFLSPSPVIIALWIWVASILWTGGLHLDGWTDVSDAYFSYSDHDKRHTILKDPRVGAFGVLSLIVLLAVKGILLYDIASQFGAAGFWLVWIPVLSRTVMALLLIRMPLAKQDGMAFFLKKSVKKEQVFIPLLLAVVSLLVPLLFYPFDWQLAGLLLIGSVAWAALFIRFAQNEFGGISGDLLGACLEGGELWSLIMVWFYLSIVMG
ncbi:adenosylcobinamide-GDP ribazoletransferase [Jeotgalibacillus sp. S-D1]|uniref:adenosylcobinamide-GDP ribazoletransferase n=1 Tax=Jeotgalibacillus sp. S-D1 TaxID=2552189 RepID=UPI001404583C|nr:adenosylcobinamide-GDP ribazoletransferase [Jeotgalibacillus sp. S-D1]